MSASSGMRSRSRSPTGRSSPPSREAVARPARGLPPTWSPRSSNGNGSMIRVLREAAASDPEAARLLRQGELQQRADVEHGASLVAGWPVPSRELPGPVGRDGRRGLQVADRRQRLDSGRVRVLVGRGHRQADPSSGPIVMKRHVARSCRVEVTVTAPVESVWRVVSDPTRTGEWSHECRQVVWLDGSTSAAPGARFRGRNHTGPWRWSRTCEVLSVDPPHVITWRTIPTWRFVDSTEWAIALAAGRDGHPDRPDVRRGPLPRLVGVARRPVGQGAHRSHQCPDRRPGQTWRDGGSTSSSISSDQRWTRSSLAANAGLTWAMPVYQRSKAICRTAMKSSRREASISRCCR